MKNKVIITDAAANDIAEQFDYICNVQRAPENASRWLQQIYAVIHELEYFARYARADESDLVGVELRKRRFKSHRILYTFDEKKRLVTIHYVRHSARDRPG